MDPDTKNPKADGAYLGYSASGEVTAPVVYAHSGNPEDYEYLRKHGIDVRGKIVLVRYSNPYSYRGFKALTAERLGAAAILIYSDPAEDGYTQGRGVSRRAVGPEEPHPARRDHLRFSGAGRSARRRGTLRCRARNGFRRSRRYRCRKSWACRFPGAMRSRCCEKMDGPDGAGFLAGRVAVQIQAGRKARGGAFESGHGSRAFSRTT